jgi:hypothetical protein
MNWLEAVFGWSPDRGNGLFELIGLLVIALYAVRLRSTWLRRRANVANANS